MAKARDDAKHEKSAIEARRQEMQAQQQAERAKLDAGQKERANAEAAARSARLRKGLRGLLDRVTGKRAALEKQNQMEAIWSLQRDREQRHAVVEAQLKDRQSLQVEIRVARNHHANVLRELHHDRTNYRLMLRGLKPLAKKAFSPLKRVIDAAAKVELPAKPVSEIGKQHMKILSRVVETGRPKSERTSPQQIPPQRKNVPDKAPAKETETLAAIGIEKPNNLSFAQLAIRPAVTKVLFRKFYTRARCMLNYLMIESNDLGILYLHALPLDGEMWAGQMSAISNKSYAPNLYKFGDDIEVWASRSLASVSANRIIVVGCSVGGSCALEIARLAPERVAALVLIATKAKHNPSPDFHQESINLIGESGVEAAWKQYWEPLFQGSNDKRFTSFAKNIALRQSAQSLLSGLSAFHTRPSREKLVAKLQMPVHVVCGDQDELPGLDYCRKLSEAAKFGHLHVIKDCGHYLPIVKAKELNAIIERTIQTEMAGS